jgi:hypothetical protein
MFRFTIRDVLWLTVVVALGLGWWMTRRDLHAERIWRNRTGALEAVIADKGLTVEWDKGVARIRNKDGSESQTLLLEAFAPNGQ